MAKMDKKWVVLCSTAVAAVYAAGYFSTEAQANKLDTQPQIKVSMQAKANQSTVSSVNKSQATGSQAAGSQTSRAAAKTVQSNRIYKDGTFKGMGENRRGYIQVAVTFKNDKITDVEISDFEMHYSEDDVVGLPGQVLKRQNAEVDNVSGATYSTQAFSDAVQDAINQAKNA